MSYPDTLSRLEDQVGRLQDEVMEGARERDRLRSLADNKNDALNEAMAEVERLRSVLTGISEYCSGEDQTLGAIARLASIRNTADQALRIAHQQSRGE